MPVFYCRVESTSNNSRREEGAHETNMYSVSFARVLDVIMVDVIMVPFSHLNMYSIIN